MKTLKFILLCVTLLIIPVMIWKIFEKLGKKGATIFAVGLVITLPLLTHMNNVDIQNIKDDFQENSSAVISQIHKDLADNNYTAVIDILSKYSVVDDLKLIEAEQLLQESFDENKEAIVSDLFEMIDNGQYNEVVEEAAKYEYFDSIEIRGVVKLAELELDSIRKFNNSFHPSTNEHYQLSGMVKSSVYDTESYRHISSMLHVNDNGVKYVQLIYVARNGFGGLSKGFVNAYINEQGNITGIFDQGSAN